MVRTAALALALAATSVAVLVPQASARLMSPILLSGAEQPFLPTEGENVCWRNLYLRGVGKIERECADGEEASLGLCYPPCKDDFDGVGPMCYASCPAGDSIGMGPICCAAFSDCTSRVVELAVKLPSQVVRMHMSQSILIEIGVSDGVVQSLDIIRAYNDRTDPMEVIKDIKKAFEDALGFRMPSCDVTQVLTISD